jgi:hypothetical protein
MSYFPPPQLADALADHGLQTLGHCPTTPTDQLPTDGTLVLIGPDEPAFWPIFETGAEFQDGEDNPLDRWSHRVMTDLAVGFEGSALFPFGGPPFQPIFTWALRTGRLWSSPSGFLVHAPAGLFVSFRGILLLPGVHDAIAGTQPCLTCTGKPCKTACPVGAFDDGYNLTACKSHLADANGHDCMTQGCRARRACPIGQGHRLPAQATHHMKAFL